MAYEVLCASWHTLAYALGTRVVRRIALVAHANSLQQNVDVALEMMLGCKLHVVKSTAPMQV